VIVVNAEQQLSGADVHSRLGTNLKGARMAINKYLAPSMCLHFFFKFRPAAVDVSQVRNHLPGKLLCVVSVYVCTVFGKWE
jgi:hypothetical protein